MYFGNKVEGRSFVAGMVLVLSFICASVGNAADVVLTIYEDMTFDGVRTAYARWGGDPSAVINVTRDESRTDGVVWLVDLSESGHTFTYFSDWVYSWEDIHDSQLYNNLYMIDASHFTFESSWSENTGNGSIVISNGVSYLAGIDYNGDSVYVRISKGVVPVDGCDAGFTNAYALDKWDNGPILSGDTWITPDNGAAGTAVFSYEVDLGSGGVSYRAARFKAKAFGDGTFSFDYDYSGFHAFFSAYADFKIFADGPNGTEIIRIVDDVRTNSYFSFTGSASIQIHHGYDFGFIVGGENYDGNSRLEGDLTISNVNGDADSDTVSDICDVCQGSDDTDDADGDGIPNGCDGCSLVPGDVNCDNKVDLLDLAMIAEYWLEGTEVVVVP